jgi:hypothetical protein
MDARPQAFESPLVFQSPAAVSNALLTSVFVALKFVMFAARAKRVLEFFA